MAVGLSTTFAHEIINAYVNAAAVSILPVTAVWIQLHNTDPGAAGTTGIGGGGDIPRKQASFGAPASGQAVTDTDLNWTTTEVDVSEDFTHWTAWTASTGGTFLQSGTVTANAVVAGDAFTIPAGDLAISFTVAT